MVRQTGRADDTEILEKGAIEFVYRPGNGAALARGVPPVERLHIVLRPAHGRLIRLAVIGRNRLPEVGDPERNWGFVQAICATPESVADLLNTPPPGCRAAGQGAYAFLQMGRALRLVYTLDHPAQPGPLQAALNIAPQASLVMSITPPAPSPAGTATGQGPAEEDRRPAPPNPEFLDFQGTEFVLLGADERAPLDPSGGSDAATSQAADVARILRQLRFAHARHPVEPLVPGAWD